MRTIVRPMYAFTFAVVALALLSPGSGARSAAARATQGSARADTTLRASTICFDCHDDRRMSLAGSPHAVAADSSGATSATPAGTPAAATHGGRGAPRIACTDCHQPDPRHWEQDPAQFPMGDPAKDTPEALAAICAGCHEAYHQQAMSTRDAHRINNVSCLACHGIHAGHGATLLLTPEPDLCFNCHGEARGQFAKPYRHPVADGVMTCSDCHLKGSDRPPSLDLRGTNQACYRCHEQFHGPFPFEHPATLDFSTEEGGCLNCHEPHGAYEPRMLRQSYDPPDFPVCRECHTVPGHLFNPEHGSRWANVPCNDCHADIHGSYDNRLLLTPALRAQGCAACHNF
jgi:DmsE family decaheme c-type cytochrome